MANFDEADRRLLSLLATHLSPGLTDHFEVTAPFTVLVIQIPADFYLEVGGERVRKIKFFIDDRDYSRQSLLNTPSRRALFQLVFVADARKPHKRFFHLNFDFLDDFFKIPHQKALMVIASVYSAQRTVQQIHAFLTDTSQESRLLSVFKFKGIFAEQYNAIKKNLTNVERKALQQSVADVRKQFSTETILNAQADYDKLEAYMQLTNIHYLLAKLACSVDRTRAQDGLKSINWPAADLTKVYDDSKIHDVYQMIHTAIAHEARSVVAGKPQHSKTVILLAGCGQADEAEPILKQLQAIDSVTHIYLAGFDINQKSLKHATRQASELRQSYTKLKQTHFFAINLFEQTPNNVLLQAWQDACTRLGVASADGADMTVIWIFSGVLAAQVCPNTMTALRVLQWARQLPRCDALLAASFTPVMINKYMARGVGFSMRSVRMADERFPLLCHLQKLDEHAYYAAACKYESMIVLNMSVNVVGDLRYIEQHYPEKFTTSLCVDLCRISLNLKDVDALLALILKMTALQYIRFAANDGEPGSLLYDPIRFLAWKLSKADRQQKPVIYTLPDSPQPLALPPLSNAQVRTMYNADPARKAPNLSRTLLGMFSAAPYVMPKANAVSSYTTLTHNK